MSASDQPLATRHSQLATTHSRLAILLPSCRVLAALAIAGPMSFPDLLHYKPLADLGPEDLALAIHELIGERRIEGRIHTVHYREGNQYLQRNVTVYTPRRG